MYGVMMLTAVICIACHHHVMRDHRYYVYIMASRTHVFYVGMTNSIVRRVREHKEGTHDGFTAKYNVNRLVWYESWHYVKNAIAREKQIKPWRREKKIWLIEAMNPTRQDLSEEWGKPIEALRTTGPSTPRPPAAQDAAENHADAAVGMTILKAGSSI